VRDRKQQIYSGWEVGTSVRGKQQMDEPRTFCVAIPDDTGKKAEEQPQELFCRIYGTGRYGGNIEICLVPDYLDTFGGVNHLVTAVQVHFQGGQIDITDCFPFITLQQFQQELEQMYHDWNRKVRFQTPSLRLTGSIDKSGHICWEASLTHQGDYKLTLQFGFQADQTYIPPLIEQLRQVEKKFSAP
jgi:hypothetical protein